MKSLFISPNPYYASGINKATIYPPLGLIYMSTILEQEGHNSRVIDANMSGMNNKKIMNIISSEDPSIIGVSANVVTERAALELLTLIKKEFKNKTIIAGGPHPTTLPETFLSNCDIVIRGEGERTILDIFEGKKLASVDGISFKTNKKIVHNKSRQLIKNLDEIPFPNYHLLEPGLKKYICRARKLPVAPLITSRGCPYQCVYCNKNIFGYTYRYRSPKNILEEIDHLVNEFGVKQIDILDDNFTLHTENTEKILDMIIERNYDIVINCQNGIRADTLTKKIIHKMKLAGVFKVGIGIESGNKEILQKIKKQLNLSKVKQVIQWFRDERIVTHGFFMLGLPWDNPQTMQETINFAIKSDPDIANFSITIPFPGTPLYTYIKKNGKFLQPTEKGTSSGFYDARVFYETTTTRKNDVLKYYKKAYKNFYFRLPKMLKLALTPTSLSEYKWMFTTGLDIFKSVILPKE
ncbi:MAG: radical SAM protein [Thermoplasmatales archaeon]|nr:MAG: radical SAM protein [Thermoplasmatales archaeon]